MSAAQDDSDSDEPPPALLRWVEFDLVNSREEPVEILASHFFEATVSSSVQLVSNTQVDLIAAHYTEKGTVRSCLADGAKFIVTIRLFPEQRNPPLGSQRDPGVFAVNDFLTEEQELRIVQEIDDEIAADRKSMKGLVTRFQIA
jgi:hypothetical protein